jgi:hypothetical protein
MQKKGITIYVQCNSGTLSQKMEAATTFLIVSSAENKEKSSEGERSREAQLLRGPFPTSGIEHLDRDYFASNL